MINRAPLLLVYITILHLIWVAHASPLYLNSLPYSEGCTNKNTCGPAWCSFVNNAACCTATGNFPSASGGVCPPVVPEQIKIAEIPCKQCSVSSDARCSSTGLKNLLAPGIGYGIKAAYCNNEFLIVHSDGSPNHPTYLEYIQRPPGSSKSSPGASYPDQCVTRSMKPQWLAMKFPLSPIALSTSSKANNAGSFPASASLTGIPLPKSGPNSMAISGLPLFPAYNDRSELAWGSCEMDGCNAHVGQGFDYHYHGDPYGGGTPNNECLYSASNYSSPSAHPPLIGISMDGYSIFGRYLDSTAPGQSIALDDCGGHIHPEIPEYHYHAQLLTSSAQGGSFVAYVAGPYNCWKGDISKISNFWDLSASPSATVAYGAQRLTSRSDYAEIQPCCGTTQYFAADGITITGTTTAPPSPTPSPSPSPTPSPSPKVPPPKKKPPPPGKKKPPPPAPKSKKSPPPPPKIKRPPPSRSPKQDSARRQFLPID
jgi:hypothetical protein